MATYSEEIIEKLKKLVTRPEHPVSERFKEITPGKIIKRPEDMVSDPVSSDEKVSRATTKEIEELYSKRYGCYSSGCMLNPRYAIDQKGGEKVLFDALHYVYDNRNNVSMHGEGCCCCCCKGEQDELLGPYASHHDLGQYSSQGLNLGPAQYTDPSSPYLKVDTKVSYSITKNHPRGCTLEIRVEICCFYNIHSFYKSCTCDDIRISVDTRYASELKFWQHISWRKLGPQVSGSQPGKPCYVFICNVHDDDKKKIPKWFRVKVGRVLCYDEKKLNPDPNVEFIYAWDEHYNPEFLTQQRFVENSSMFTTELTDLEWNCCDCDFLEPWFWSHYFHRNIIANQGDRGTTFTFELGKPLPKEITSCFQHYFFMIKGKSQKEYISLDDKFSYTIAEGEVAEYIVSFYRDNRESCSFTGTIFAKPKIGPCLRTYRMGFETETEEFDIPIDSGLNYLATVSYSYQIDHFDQTGNDFFRHFTIFDINLDKSCKGEEFKIIFKKILGMVINNLKGKVGYRLIDPTRWEFLISACWMSEYIRPPDPLTQALLNEYPSKHWFGCSKAKCIQYNFVDQTEIKKGAIEWKEGSEWEWELKYPEGKDNQCKLPCGYDSNYWMEDFKKE